VNTRTDRRTRRRSTHARSVAALVIVFIIALAGCGPSGATTGGDDNASGLSIVATTTILGDVTTELLGDAGEVSVLMPAGTDPHTFEASARQLAEMQEADLIVANGANLEEHLQDPLTEAEQAGAAVFHAIDHVETLAFAGHPGEEAHEEGEEAHEGEEHASEQGEEAHAHEEGSADPHFWQDPTRMADAVVALGDQIGELSDDPDAIGQRADRYAEQLAQLDGEIADTLASIPDDSRTLVTNHEAFNYFAEHYGFTIVGAVIPNMTTGAEPSAQDLEQLAHTVEQEGVRAVFAENTQPEQLAQTLAQEVGADVQVVELYSDALGDEGSDATTYSDMLRANAQLISEALGT
jgi:zinc/manganese transport system substrate-binding protein